MDHLSKDQRRCVDTLTRVRRELRAIRKTQTALTSLSSGEPRVHAAIDYCLEETKRLHKVQHVLAKSLGYYA